MTGRGTSTGGSGGLPTAEHELAARVVDALLREDYGGLSRRVRETPDGLALCLPGGTGLGLGLERDGFLADHRIRRPAPAGLTISWVRAALEAIASSQDRGGAAAFAAECNQALAALRLWGRHLPRVQASLGELCGADPRCLLGAAGQRFYDAVAAAVPHPVYPTSQSRLGFSDEDSLLYAPEYLPEFTLGWAAVPRAALTRAGGTRQAWWPGTADVGLPASLAATHELIPVHPLTARRCLRRALRESGLRDSGPVAGVPAPGTFLRVTPTLSTRTVAVTGDPEAHLKLPLPTSTLGLANRRSIMPGTLADGALVAGILAAAAAADEQLTGLLAADEGCYGHAAHPYLGYLLRRLRAGLGECRIVPLAALLAPAPRAGQAPAGRLVIEDLAGWRSGGDVLGLLDEYFAVLFGVSVRLLARYGIALEAHQQNAALVIGPDRGSGARLLVKDFDGALIRHDRLRSVLGAAAPPRSAFTDSRLLTGSDAALADVFVTITVHLCAGAIAFGLARHGILPADAVLALARRRLAEALDRNAGYPAAALLRARVLDAMRLPGKSMVTAGTLVARSRTGARDINKFYGVSGPNYLRDAR